MFRTLLYCYSFLYALGLILYLPVLLIQGATSGKRTVLSPRLGFDSSFRNLRGAGSKTRIWVHAVSVGEINAMRPVIKRLLDSNHDLVISTTTLTGRHLADELFATQAQVIYFPLDLASICSRYLRRIRPQAVIVAETELWPNFIFAAHRLRIPLIIVNGRVSDKSFNNYRRLHSFFGPLLERVSHFCMQTRIDKERILAIGAPEQRVNWVGNLKYDYTMSSPPEKEALRDALGRLLAPENEPILLCGSTKPGEEEQLIPVFCNLRKEFPKLKLLLAPRHPHRGTEVAAMLNAESLVCGLRSQLDLTSSPPLPLDAIVLDSVGELAHLYALADVVFMGGSLVPTGGQNIIEPAAFGKPILFGPSMSNFREIAQSFTEAYAALQVESADELQARLKDLLGDPHAREWLGRNARKVIRTNQGAIERTIEIFNQYLPDRGDVS